MVGYLYNPKTLNFITKFIIDYLSLYLQILMNVLKVEMVVLRHALTQLVVTHAPASLVIDWEMMNKRVLVSNVPHCIQITIMI